ncbi:zinc-binding dehydrogenase [Streptomyces sp. NPDC059455]|uniref:zinc-binding dehydrogenase n=1 Tax=Streptomyces sp. NPDC059455 TaxID=3346837 RepID=UPI0036795356
MDARSTTPTRPAAAAKPRPAPLTPRPSPAPRAHPGTAAHPEWADEVHSVAGGRAVSVALDPIGGKPAERLLDLLAPGGKPVSYGLIAEEPISVHAATLLNKSLTLRGKNVVGRWLSEASAERRASDMATARQIALGLTDQFDVAATYGLGELAGTVEHAVRPGKVGTVLVRTW